MERQEGRPWLLQGPVPRGHCYDLLPTKQDFPTLTLSRFSKHLPGSASLKWHLLGIMGLGRFLGHISGHKAIVLTGSSKNDTFPLGVSLVSRRPFIETPMKTPTQCEQLTARCGPQEKVPCRYLFLFVASQIPVFILAEASPSQSCT